MYLVIGLGNPGEKYQYTRHNVGFMLLDKIIESKGLTWEYNKKFKANICKNANTIYVKPQTFMNNSGQTVQAIMSYYKLLPKKLGIIKQKNSDLSEILTIIHDDIDIDLGKYKISTDSRSAGHNGVQSIINHLKTKNFKRARIGIRTGMLVNIPAQKFVLQKFNQEEKSIINKVIQEVIFNI